MVTVLERAKQRERDISLYIHIPFCQTKCPYCDFNTYEGLESLMGPYMDALVTEIQLWGRTLCRPRVNTVFFGGGTPSYAPSDGIRSVLGAVGNAFPLASGGEISVEANPGDLTNACLKELLDMGINRLSIGVQSLDDPLLKLLGRRHSAKQAVEAYRLSRSAGFDNVNLDLMYGLPEQTIEQWRDTVVQVLELDPPHLSLYCLTLEKGTPLERWVREGKLPEPDPDLAADMYCYVRDELAGAGYHHYEISNWSMPGHECRHNMAYWRNLPYLGVGPGAHSNLDGHRFWNVASPRDYIRRVHDWAQQDGTDGAQLDRSDLTLAEVVTRAEPIGPELEMAETMILGLRLLDGLKTEEFARRFGLDVSEVYGSQIAELSQYGLLESADGVLRLTPKGCLLANQVFIRFLE